jgi:hypothetical protein
MEMNDEFMIYDLRLAIPKTSGGQKKRGVAMLKSSITDHRS